MLEDILLIEQKHKKASAIIVDEVIKRYKEKLIVAISGESGSGKSELTHLVAKRLISRGIVAKPIHIDNFYKTHPLERNKLRLEQGIDRSVGDMEYDWLAINRVLNDFMNNQKSSMPCVDLVTQQVETLITDFKGIDVLILDGLYAIKTRGCDLRVMIDLSYHETKKAQLLRGKEEEDDIRLKVLEAEHKAVNKLRSLADIFISYQ